VFVEFRVRATGETGRAIFVRMAGADGESLFRREMRRSVVVARLETGNHVIEYSFLDRTRPREMWMYDPKTRRMERSFTDDVEYGEPVYDVCKALEAANLARDVDVSAAVVGYVTPSPELRRLIAVTRGCS
jgi:hypothetical protein